MADRVTQNPSLVPAEGSSNARVTQEPALVIGEGTQEARVTQVPLLVLGNANTAQPLIFVVT